MRKARSHNDLQVDALRDFVEGELRDAIRQDGGDITFEEVEGSIVRVRMGAMCSICPAASKTAKHYVERKLRERFAEDIVVEARIVKPYFWR